MNKYRVTVRFETEASSEKEAVAAVTAKGISTERVEVTKMESEEEDTEKRVGTLRTRQGIVGIAQAEVGSTVYDTGSRYRIYMDNGKRAVDYYYRSLFPEIIFDSVSQSE